MLRLSACSSVLRLHCNQRDVRIYPYTRKPERQVCEGNRICGYTDDNDAKRRVHYSDPRAE